MLKSFKLNFTFKSYWNPPILTCITHSEKHNVFWGNIRGLCTGQGFTFRLLESYSLLSAFTLWWLNWTDLTIGRWANFGNESFWYCGTHLGLITNTSCQSPGRPPHILSRTIFLLVTVKLERYYWSGDGYLMNAGIAARCSWDNRHGQMYVTAKLILREMSSVNMKWKALRL